MSKKQIILLFFFIFQYQQHNQWICAVCETAQQSMLNHLSKNMQTIQKTAQIICDFILPSNVCHYFIDQIGLDYIRQDLKFFKRTNYFCSFTLPLCQSKYGQFSQTNFERDLLKKYPKPNLKNDYVDEEKFSALVLSDVHIQRDYLYRGKVNCSDPASCCYQPLFNPFETEEQAGYWGTPGSNCDIPKRLFDKTLIDMQSKGQDSQFLILLGDNYGHNYFRDESEKDLIDSNAQFYSDIKENFQDKMIIPVLGNHESHPVNAYDFESRKNFVIENILPNFVQFIGQEKVNQLIDDGFYSIEDETLNIKFISISPFIAFKQNPSLVYQNTDILQFLEKFSQSLYESEQKNQKAILLCHIPFTHSDIFPEFQTALRIIMERFENTVQSALSSHTHSNQMRMLYNRKQEVQLINFIVPSLTTMSNYLPSYSVFKFSSNGSVFDYFQYRLDIQKYNELADYGRTDLNLNFDLFHQFRKDYQIEKWGPNNYTQFVKTLVQNDKKLITYLKNLRGKDIKGITKETREKLRCVFNNGFDKEIEACKERIFGKTYDWYVLFDFFFKHPWLVPVKSNYTHWIKQQNQIKTTGLLFLLSLLQKRIQFLMEYQSF